MLHFNQHINIKYFNMQPPTYSCHYGSRFGKRSLFGYMPQQTGCCHHHHRQNSGANRMFGYMALFQSFSSFVNTLAGNKRSVIPQQTNFSEYTPVDSTIDIKKKDTNGKYQTAEKFEEFSNKNTDSTISFEVLGDDWRKLVGKEDKTDEEKAKLDKDYKTAFANLGEQNVKYIDEAYGNGDGILTKDEFAKYNLNGKKTSEAEDAKAASENMFNNIDIDGNGKIDSKEMAAMFTMFDQVTSVDEEGEKEGGINGKLKVRDINNCTANLIQTDNDAIKQRLQSMHKFLFPQE